MVLVGSYWSCIRHIFLILNHQARVCVRSKHRVVIGAWFYRRVVICRWSQIADPLEVAIVNHISMAGKSVTQCRLRCLVLQNRLRHLCLTILRATTTIVGNHDEGSVQIRIRSTKNKKIEKPRQIHHPRPREGEQLEDVENNGGCPAKMQAMM